MNSLLKKRFQVKTITGNVKLIPFLGRKVRYKKELLTEEFLKRNGTVCENTVFVIKEVQIDYKGNEILRGYYLGDEFGRCIRPDDVELI